MYLNFLEISSIILLVLAIITLIIGIFKKKKNLSVIGRVIFLIIFFLWVIVFSIGLLEENPNRIIEKENKTVSQERFSKENIEKNNVNAQPQDVTQKILNNEFYSSGIIYNIDDDNIYFSNSDSKQYYINKNFFSYLNGRTTKDINVKDVKVGDYLQEDDKKVIIYRNISGNELNQELLYNMTLTGSERIRMVNTIGIEDINIIDKNTAIVKIMYGDIIGNEITDETFEALVEFNSNTKFYSKGNNINSINDLEYAKYNINSIVLDRDTINKKSPAIVNTFDSTDT